MASVGLHKPPEMIKSNNLKYCVMDKSKLIELLKDAWNDGNSQYHDCKHNWEYKQDLQNWLDNYEGDINDLCEGNTAKSENANCAIFDVSASLLPDMEMEEAEVLSMQCDYACFAVEADENEINTADASAFFLEGYLEAQRRLKSNER